MEENPTLNNILNEPQIQLRRQSTTWERAGNFILTFFTFGIVLVERYSWLNNINRAMGIFFVLLAIFWLKVRSGRPSNEVILFGVFIVWTLVTGVVVTVDPDMFWAMERLVIQELALFFAVVEFIVMKRQPSTIFKAMIGLAFFMAVYSYSVGEVGRVVSSKWERASSIVGNPNFLGFVGVYGLMSLAYFWIRDDGMQKTLKMVLFLPIIFGIIIISGSRKSFMGAILFIFCLLFFRYRQVFFRNIRYIVFAIIIAISLYYAGTFVMDHSVLGNRMSRTMKDPRYDSSRYYLYKKGWELMIENPMSGVGLGGFLVASGTGTYSHSDYMEVLSTTGIIGFILYFSIYFLVWQRLILLNRIFREDPEHYRLSLFKAMIITILFLGIGSPNFLSVIHWIIMGGIIGHCISLSQRKIREEESTLPPRSVIA